MAKMGRPRKQIDQKQFESLCYIQCTQEEILAVLDVDDKTLTKWCNEVYGKSFSDAFKAKRQGGKMSLRRTQWRLAEHNPTMAIFLGKNYLGQRDKAPEEIRENEIKAQESLVSAIKDALDGNK